MNPSLAELQGHAPVIDPRILENPAFRLEAEPSVKGFRFTLRIKKEVADAPLSGERDQVVQHGGADALSAPGGQDRHATDMSIGQHARGGNRGAVRGYGDEVKGMVVVFVVFEFWWNPLFVDEYRKADPEQLLLPAAPVGRRDKHLQS
jgi:hypothetical protein